VSDGREGCRALLVHEIGSIVTAACGFDAARGLRRIDPLDGAAVRRLLRTR
jgi:hypothetical protein